MMDRFPSAEPARHVFLSVMFGAGAVLLFYFVGEVASSTAPIHPDVLMIVLFGGPALGAVVFVYGLNIPYAVFVVTILATIPLIFILVVVASAGAAGGNSPVIPVFMVIILAIALLGGGIGARLKTVL